MIEKVLLTGGELYLHTREHTLAWYQLALLDVYAVLAAGCLALLGVALAVFWLLLKAARLGLRRLRGSSKQKAA